MVGVVEMLRAVVEGKPGRRGRQGPGMRWHSETGEQSSEVVYGQIGLSNVDFAHQARPGINVMDDLSLNVSAGRGTDGFNGLKVQEAARVVCAYDFFILELPEDCDTDPESDEAETLEVEGGTQLIWPSS
ncbi:hypothetical protein C2857_004212 [Epichloe festucae Fl1]|uniref:Uncharacterized protein n=1 Tax=Epichloe festucae (strain Fl1) TaxID=877507 RepID=A0A7S9PU09_EPIFF|nr:hypothetical protein C2857_004212 [Epichloe festucae Fl1]